MCHIPIMFAWVRSKQAVFDSIPDLFQRAENALAVFTLITYFVHQFVGRYKEPLAASQCELEDWTYRYIRGGNAAWRAIETVPYVFASLPKLAIASTGSMSLILPSNGRPGGPGIISVIAY
jgi:hypothetical protein